MLDKYNRLRFNSQSKIGYDSLTQNVILYELVNIMSGVITVMDIKRKMKFSRIYFLEIKKFSL